MRAEVGEMLDALVCTYYDETENRVFNDYMRKGGAGDGRGQS